MASESGADTQSPLKRRVQQAPATGRKNRSSDVHFLHTRASPFVLAGATLTALTTTPQLNQTRACRPGSPPPSNFLLTNTIRRRVIVCGEGSFRGKNLTRSFTFVSCFVAGEGKELEMGYKLSCPSLTPSEHEFYIQVKDSLVVGKFKFSKGLLKRFVHWVFKQFPTSNLSII